ncbi:unnamed protein product [Peniophora sp. CBMAI 1063]|nr:unnamed protein product [Peniophora sp. CBMAI 1063]
MGAVDPTYPLLPIASVITSLLLLLVLFSSFARQSWNLGVTFLCFWLFFENIAWTINAIIWSDNADIKLYVYCDIVSHLQILTSVVKPMSSLLIMRRLYLIANSQAVESPTDAMRRKDRLIEWTIGLVIPVLVAGPIYYVIQGSRFAVSEGFGCGGAMIGALKIVLIQPWLILPPLLALTVYYPRVVRILYRQHTELNRFLQTNQSISRSCYLRVLALASVDIIFSLSLNTTGFVLYLLPYIGSDQPDSFYPGWDSAHSDWSPKSHAYAGLGTEKALLFFTRWTTPIFAIVIFGLFGLTQGARASYREAFWTVNEWLRQLPYNLVFFRRLRNKRMREVKRLSIESGSSDIDMSTSSHGLTVDKRHSNSDWTVAGDIEHS